MNTYLFFVLGDGRVFLGAELLIGKVMEPEERRSTAGSEIGISEEAVDGEGLLTIGFRGGGVFKEVFWTLRLVSDERGGPCIFGGCWNTWGYIILGCGWAIGGYTWFGTIPLLGINWG